MTPFTPGIQLRADRDTNSASLLATREAKPQMTETQGTIVVELLLILIILSLWPALKPAPKWEYKIESVSDLGFEPYMQNLGKDGWELVFARRASSGTDAADKPVFSYEMIFKRPAR